MVGAPKAGAEAAPKVVLPNAPGAAPNAALLAPKAGVAGCAPNAGVDAAPNAGCTRVAYLLAMKYDLYACNCYVIFEDYQLF